MCSTVRTLLGGNVVTAVQKPNTLECNRNQPRAHSDCDVFDCVILYYYCYYYYYLSWSLECSDMLDISKSFSRCVMVSPVVCQRHTLQLNHKCTDFNSSTRVTVYAECIYVFLTKSCPRRWIPCWLLTNTAVTSAVTNFWCRKLIAKVNK